DDAFQAGITAGKTAVQLQNDKPDGHFWLGANYGGAAEHSSIAGLATVNDIKSEMKTVEEMEKGLRFGEPNAFLHLHLAEAYKKVGRHDDARRELKKILSMPADPNYLPEYKEASAAAQK